MFKLFPGHQNYPWGKASSSSLIYLMQSSRNPDLPDSIPYAELWLGSHPSLPSNTEFGVPLDELIKKEPLKYLGETSLEIFQDEKSGLPFLFKILNVGKALSIQAHPDKKLAKKLFETKPEIYKDPNHKPEMAIALSEFEAFCNFAKKEEIINYLDNYKEFSLLFEKKDIEDFRDSNTQEQAEKSLKTLIRAFLNLPEEKISSTIEEIVKKLEAKTEKILRDEILLRLNKEFPLDMGILFTFFLEYVILKPGECLVMGANEPHAYLKGDCLECMANSDNVVRAGLTPKLKDKETLYEVTFKFNFRLILF
jgi:mannose-6-phosphate isomerase